MTCAEIINLILCILSFLLAAISVVTVVITLKQNNKMIESNARPYVVAYLVYEEFFNQTYLCVKNFGNTSAIIKELTITPPIHFYQKTSNEIFNQTMIAPKQQIHFLALDETRQDRLDKGYIGTVNVVYLDCVTNKEYRETYNISTEYTQEVMTLHSSNSGMTKTENSLRNIENILAFNKNSNM